MGTVNQMQKSSQACAQEFSPDNQQLASSSYAGELKLWETQKSSPEVAAQRDVVQHATNLANHLTVQHRTPKAALSHLMEDNSVSEELLPTVTAILQARLPAPVNLNALSEATNRKSTESKNAAGVRTANPPLLSASALKEKLEAMLADGLPDILQLTQHAPDPGGTDKWNTLCRNLVLPATFKLQPAQLIDRLQQIKEGGDTTHYVHYLKAFAHLHIAEYALAADEMSQAIRLVPEKSPLWITYGFRLSFLLAYVGRWDEYQRLCTTALNNFEDDSDAVNLERLAKMCLFSKNLPDLNAAASIADKALAQTDFIAPKVFVRLTKGIAELRRQNYAASLEHLEFVSKYGLSGGTQGHQITLATAHVYSAIALYRLNRQDEARRHLTEAEPIIRDFPSTSGWWPDWMLASIVFNEVRELLNSADTLAP